MRFEFASFILDLTRHELTRRGISVRLTPKAFDLLAVMVREAPRVVPKAELHRRIWPKTVVSDVTLAGLVKELRRALRDAEAPGPAIRTVHRVGYGFCLDVKHDRKRAARASHWLVIDGRRFPLHEGRNLIGRDLSADVCLDAASASRHHAYIVVGEDGAVLEDNGSKNGTRVGDDAASGPIGLHDSDRLCFGTVAAVYRTSGAGPSTVTHMSDGRRAHARRRETCGSGDSQIED